MINELNVYFDSQILLNIVKRYCPVVKTVSQTAKNISYTIPLLIYRNTIVNCSFLDISNVVSKEILKYVAFNSSC